MKVEHNFFLKFSCSTWIYVYTSNLTVQHMGLKNVFEVIKMLYKIYIIFFQKLIM